MIPRGPIQQYTRLYSFRKRRRCRSIALAVLSLLSLTGYRLPGAELPASERSERVVSRIAPLLKVDLERKGLELGSPVFMRIFKEEEVLELWVEDSAEFKLFRTYPICYYSGHLGPKLKTGDRQSPEGFYYVTPSRLNPWSDYHLSFNLGYPNAYDRAHGRTGKYLMVHGSCASIGCYAMTDAGIEEIYTMAYEALRNGQPFFRVHIFPFRLSEKNLESHKDSRWTQFWLNLKEGYDWFEKRRTPPDVTVENGRYVFNEDH